MNVHHLELFYYVARHGGISEAVRRMPYGIQQPAVSAQIIQLEDYLGVTLFHRRPFSLTPEGDKLFGFVEPFFRDLDKVAQELQGGAGHQLRGGASEIVLRDYLPELLQKVQKRFPKLRVSLRQGYAPDLIGWLGKGEIDFAITLVEKKAPAGLQSRALLELPLVLLVEKKSRFTSPEQIWALDKIEEPLICLPPSEPICKRFQQELSQRGVDWFPSIEVSSLGLIETYVAAGFGIGLSVAVPRGRLDSKIGVFALTDFAPVVLGVLWRGKPSALLRALFSEMDEIVRGLA